MSHSARTSLFTRLALRTSLLLLGLLASVGAAWAQGTAFSYQGKLTDGGAPANGSYDLQFALFDSSAGGAQIGTTQTLPSVQVSNGAFSVRLDFGVSAFPGADRFLDIAVRPAGVGSFTTLSPRQQISAAPYAIHTISAARADTLSSNCVGCVLDAQIGSVSASKLSGALPVGSVPAGSANYLQNTTTMQAGTNFNISGDGNAGGTLSGNAVNAGVQFNLGGQRILSNAGLNNLFVGAAAGASNTGGGNSFFGASAGSKNVDGDGNSYFGLNAGNENVSGSWNSIFGAHAGTHNTGSNNSFFGATAGLNNTSGSDNAFFGYSAGESSTGSRNSLFGSSTGNSSGNDNTFIGYQAGLSNGSGGGNTYVGSQAGRANPSANLNTFVGFQAGFSSTNNSNTFLGGAAGINNTSGGSNTFVGEASGQFNVTGSNNVSLGFTADFTSPNLDHATVIGAGATVSTSNTIMLGRGFTDNVVVGNRLKVQSIPLLASTAQVCFNGAGDLLQCGASSLRWKTNVRPFLGGLDIISRLRPISFNWKEGGLPDVGLGAEEVARVAPSFVFTNREGEVEGVKYERLNILLINAIKEQQQEIEELQRQVRSLRASRRGGRGRR